MKFNLLLISFVLFFISMTSVLNGQNDDMYDHKILINVDVDQIVLRPIVEPTEFPDKKMVFGEYYLTYIDSYNSIKFSVIDYNFQTVSNNVRYPNAAINVLFWNFPKKFNPNKITLSETKKKTGTSTSMTSLFEEYYNIFLKNDESYETIFLFSIPINDKVDSIFPELRGQSKYRSRTLYVLWKERVEGERFPDEIKAFNVVPKELGLNLSIKTPPRETVKKETEKITYHQRIKIDSRPNEYIELKYLVDKEIKRINEEDKKTTVSRFSKVRKDKIMIAETIQANYIMNKATISSGEKSTITFNFTQETVNRFLKDIRISIKCSNRFGIETNVPNSNDIHIKLSYNGNPKLDTTINNSLYIISKLFDHDKINYLLTVKSNNSGYEKIERYLTKEDFQKGIVEIDLINKKDYETYAVNFNVKTSKHFDFKNMPKQSALELSFPKSSFDTDDKYMYNPATDLYNRNSEFSKKWKLLNPTDFTFFLNDKKSKKVDIHRASKERSYVIKISGNFSKGIKVNYNLKSDLYKPPYKKTKEIKGKGVVQQFVEEKLQIPDTILPHEKISIEFKKPFNYNISQLENTSDWKIPDIEIPIERFKDTIELKVEKIPPFQFFYIDLSGFENLQKIKDLLKVKIGKENNDYFIFVSNSNRPLIWQTGDDLDELLTRISLMRPAPAFYSDEKKHIELYLDKINYYRDRREVHFNFLFSESFLNHSSQDFIQMCLLKLNDIKPNSSGRLKITTYSTVKEPKYFDPPIYDEDKESIAYKKL